MWPACWESAEDRIQNGPPGKRVQLKGLLPRYPSIHLIIVSLTDQLHVQRVAVDTVDDAILARVHSQQIRRAVEFLVVVGVGVSGEFDDLQKNLPGMLIRQAIHELQGFICSYFWRIYFSGFLSNNGLQLGQQK